MKLLLSNDDGIHAKGLLTLAYWLGQEHEVYIVAPDQERSAQGHALTLHSPLRVTEVSVPGAKKAYKTSGTPSDCVKLALSTLLEDEMDVVIAGINHGPNLGSDVMYSGTVSAASEGAVLDKKAIALSLMNGFEPGADFETPSQFVADNLAQWVALDFPRQTVLNINFPSVSIPLSVGVKVTKLGLRMYEDSYERRVDPRGQVYYWLAGEVVGHGGSDYEDVEAIRNNWVSITPVHLDLTHHDFLAPLRQLETTFE